jgi:hypothetical protein
MSASPNRRSFLSASALGLGGMAFLDHLPAVSADDARIDSKLVRLDPEIEPLVRLIEDTPRDVLLEAVATRIKRGTPYRDVLAALLLAGVRNVEPRPNVGFKFHAVLVVNSAHLASLAGPDRERWLPIFWALDHFKSSQAQNIKERNGWRMGPVNEAKVPPAEKARAAFAAAMDNWHEDEADAAAAALARHVPTHEAFDLFARYGCRDFRDIGHKAIFVANAFRTLDTIGRQHAEPVYRSLAYALLQHEGDNPSKADRAPDQPGRRNAELARKLKADWAGGKNDPAVAGDVLAASRTESADAMCDKTLSLLTGGVSPRAVWDGLFAAGGELLMRQPGIVALHSLTSLNALHHAYQTSAVDETRKVLLLQAAAFVPLFRDAMKSRGKVGDARIDALQPDPGAGDVGEVFSTLSKDKPAAARLALGLAKESPAAARQLVDAGRLLVFLKGTDSHDYKFSSAVLEDYTHISPAWRDRFLAASVFWLKGSAGPDAPVVKRTRAALA